MITYKKIYNKVVTGLFSKTLFLATCSFMMVSCVDTLILPDDKTVDEDFWKSKSDVQLMVNGAYQRMLNADVISRLIVWGDLRSEEAIPVASITGSVKEDLEEINLGNTQTDNTFATWTSIYAVINRCNMVLQRAEGVMSEDPNYTNGDYLADRAQMLALRSLCYFYLVRNFRDVPFITEAYFNSSQDRNVAQSDPESVLKACLEDLKEAEQNAISASAFTDWRRVGYFTRDAINALQADIYLWRGSVLHNTADYEQAVAYCDKVIASKKSQHVRKRGETVEKDYYLSEGREAFYDIFVNKNAEESIFELQFQNGTNGNAGTAQYFNHNDGKDGSVPFLYASSIFKYGGEVYTSGSTQADYRAMNYTYTNNGGTTVTVGDFDGLRIRKYVASESYLNVPSQVGTAPGYNSTLDMDYIIYRLSDIMLMKAEALTALASDDADASHLHAAFNLVKVVNLRSKQTESDSLKWNTYSDGKSTMENLILAERLRELAFEGKRWYDLMRFSYRHMEGVDYSTTLAQQNDEGKTFVAVYDEMLNLMKRKLSGKGNAVAAKMNTEPRLYMPIPLSDINISPQLRQNPSYSDNDNINKN